MARPDSGTPEIPWPSEWKGMTHDQRRDDLLSRMLWTRPKQHKEYIGKSVRIPRVKGRKRDNTKPVGFTNLIPPDTLLGRVNAAIPPMRSQWRDDMVQDVALAILSGEVPESILDDLKALRKFRNKVIAQYPERWAYLGTDDPAKDVMELLKDGESHDFADLQKVFRPE